MLGKLLTEVETAAEELVALILLMLPATALALGTGLLYCQLFPSYNCYRVQPFIYGIFTVTMVLIFYKLAPYIEHFFDCLNVHGLSGIHVCVKQVLDRIIFDIENSIEERLNRDDNQESDKGYSEDEGFQGFK